MRIMLFAVSISSLTISFSSEDKSPVINANKYLNAEFSSEDALALIYFIWDWLKGPKSFNWELVSAG